MPFVDLQKGQQNTSTSPVETTSTGNDPYGINTVNQSDYMAPEAKTEKQNDGVTITSKPFSEPKKADIPSTNDLNVEAVPQKEQVIAKDESSTVENSSYIMKQSKTPEQEAPKKEDIIPEPVQVKTDASNETENMKPDSLPPLDRQLDTQIPSGVVSPSDLNQKRDLNQESKELLPELNGLNLKETVYKNIDEYTKLAIEKHSSDIHFTAAYPVYLRLDGGLEKVSTRVMSASEIKDLIYSILSDKQKQAYEKGEDLDFMYIDADKNRFRINVFKEKGSLAAAFRSIPQKVRTIEELSLPPILKEFSKIPYGLVVVTGPTGSGKSTTIAAMIEEINKTEAKHIVTIEDPVEYIYEQGKSIIVQRNLHEDTLSWGDALRSVLRQDPNVVLIGEMRDFDTIASALTIAETGHLVFATLHTNNAAQTIDRIIDVFPSAQQNQVRSQLSSMLSGVISQRLVPLKNGGRRAAMEILIATNAVKNAIRESKTHQINNIIQTSSEIGMITIEKSLVDLIRSGLIDIETAKNFTMRPDEIDMLLQ